MSTVCMNRCMFPSLMMRLTEKALAGSPAACRSLMIKSNLSAQVLMSRNPRKESFDVPTAISMAHVRVVVEHSPTFDVGVELRPAFNRIREARVQDGKSPLKVGAT